MRFARSAKAWRVDQAAIACQDVVLTSRPRQPTPRQMSETAAELSTRAVIGRIARVYMATRWKGWTVAMIAAVVVHGERVRAAGNQYPGALDRRRPFFRPADGHPADRANGLRGAAAAGGRPAGLLAKDPPLNRGHAHFSLRTGDMSSAQRGHALPMPRPLDTMPSCPPEDAKKEHVPAVRAKKTNQPATCPTLAVAAVGQPQMDDGGAGGYRSLKPDQVAKEDH